MSRTLSILGIGNETLLQQIIYCQLLRIAKYDNSAKLNHYLKENSQQYNLILQ
jgi:hypothetical protein